MTALAWILLILIVLAALIALAAWFYERASNEVALVRTGAGGRRVVIDGGVLAVPYFHEIARVNMQTIRMDVSRTGAQSLITKDRLRVDVGAEFYASVQPEAAAVTRAAQTLGKRTFRPDELRSLIDGMMVDALRSVAARMTMDELHENRNRFASEVRGALEEPLANYGLRLDSVSLTALDQTPFAALDENNAFNAVGMRKLAEVISTSKKERAAIENDSEVAVRRSAMEAEKRKLEIALEQRRAEIAQTQEIEGLMAAQMAEVAQRKAASERAAAEARIAMERDIEAAEIARAQSREEAEIAKARALEIAEQDRLIQIAAKSEEESAAQARADAARADAIRAAEAVTTAQETAAAERRATLAKMLARQEAEATALRATIAAQTDRATAEDKAAASAAATEADKTAALARAEADRAAIEARNVRSETETQLEMERLRLEAMPKILAEMVKPAEKIQGISVNHITGLGASGEAPRAPINATLDTILDMAVQMPAMQKIGEAVGVNLQKGMQDRTSD